MTAEVLYHNWDFSPTCYLRSVWDCSLTARVIQKHYSATCWNIQSNITPALTQSSDLNLVSVYKRGNVRHLRGRRQKNNWNSLEVLHISFTEMHEKSQKYTTKINIYECFAPHFLSFFSQYTSFWSMSLMSLLPTSELGDLNIKGPWDWI